MTGFREELKNSKRIVIKVGTSSLTYENGRLNIAAIDKLARTIADIANQGREVVLVSSGAIGVGTGLLRLDKRPDTTIEKQAVAAVGQCELMHIYSKLFLEYGIYVGQILLTRDVVEEDDRRRHVINTFNKLIDMKIVPIVNENDSVSVEEIEFGDNDTLSAIVSELIDADLLVILSDIDGLYDKDPRTNSDAKLIPVVMNITKEIEEVAGGAGSSRGTGGMQTKISAGKIATAAGTNMVIANSQDPTVIYDILTGTFKGTLFVRKDRINHESK